MLEEELRTACKHLIWSDLDTRDAPCDYAALIAALEATPSNALLVCTAGPVAMIARVLWAMESRDVNTLLAEIDL